MNLKKTLIKSSLLLAMVGAGVMFGSSGASAASLDVVAGTASSTEGDGQCQLVEAIANINGQIQTNGNTDCPAGDGDNDTINLPEGTVIQAANLPQLRVSMTIKGKGPGLSTVDGNGNSRMFYSDYLATNMVLKFEDFTAEDIASGFGGGACFGFSSISSGDINASLEFVNLNLNSCYGGIGVSTASNLNTRGISAVVDGVNVDSGNGNLESSGLGFRDLKNITVRSSSVNGYSIGLSMYSEKNSVLDYEVTNSTFSGNSQGVFVGLGVALNCSCGSPALNLELYNNTIYGNASEQGSYFYGVSWATGLRLRFNGGTSFNVIMANNLIANNMDDSTLSNCFVQSGSVALSSSGGNLADDDCDGAFGSNDFINTSGIGASIGPLQLNGSGVRTMALLEGSPAIDAGVDLSSVLTTDARGVARPQHALYDVGAYEAVFDNDGTVTDDPDVIPDGENNQTGGVISSVPGAPRTGVVLGSLIAALAFVGIVILVVKEILESRERAKLKSELKS